MAKVFAPKPTIPWQPGGLSDPNAPQPVPADGPFMVDYKDASGKPARTVADFTDSSPVTGATEISFANVYRWIATSKVP